MSAVMRAVMKKRHIFHVMLSTADFNRQHKIRTEGAQTTGYSLKLTSCFYLREFEETGHEHQQFGVAAQG